MADLQPQVPQHVEDELDDAFAPGGLLEGAQEQQVDVRSRRQLAAAIAAGRHHRDTLGAGGILGVIDMLGGEVVDHLDDGVLQQRQGARCRQARQAFLLHRVLHLVAAVGEGLLDQGQAGLAQGSGSPLSLASAVRPRRRASASIRSRKARLWGFSRPMAARIMSWGAPLPPGETPALLGFAARNAVPFGRAPGADDHAAGDAVTGIAHGLAAIIIAPRIHDDGHAVAVENGTLAVAQAEAAGEGAGMQMAVGAGELVGQVAGLRSAFRQIAMLLAGHQGQDRPRAGEAGLGVAIARDMQMDGMGAGRQAGRSNSPARRD